MTIMIPAWVNGELVPVEKLEAHKRGLPHKAVSVFVLRGSEVLMQRRALSKYHTPGLWTNTCCTHPDFDESAYDCAVRRLHEELGIKGLLPEHRHHLEYRADVGGGLIEHEHVDVFIAEASPDMEIDCNQDEVMDVEWVAYSTLLQSIETTPDKYTPWLRIYLTDYADMIFGSELLTHSV